MVHARCVRMARTRGGGGVAGRPRLFRLEDDAHLPDRAVLDHERRICSLVSALLQPQAQLLHLSLQDGRQSISKVLLLGGRGILLRLWCAARAVRAVRAVRAARAAHAALAVRAAVMTAVRCGAAQHSATGRLGGGGTLASARAAASMSISFKTPTMRSHTLSRCSFRAFSSIPSFPTTVLVCAMSSVRMTSLSLRV